MEHPTLKLEELEKATPLQAVLKLAVPTVAGQIILVVYNMADTFFIGMTGSDAMITAVTVCMPAFMFLSAISNLFGVGGSSAISRAEGRRDFDRVGRTAGFAFWGCLGVTVAYALLAWVFIDLFIDLLGGSSPDVHGYARQYLTSTVILGGFAASMSGLFAHLIRSEGRAGKAAFGIALGGVLNILLDPLFMFVILKPGQEALGASVATALSNVCSLVYFAIVLWRGREGSLLSFRAKGECVKNGIPKDVLVAGLPACIMTLFENISYAVLDNLMSGYGVTVQAGVGVAKKVNMLAHCIVRGMSQGVLPLIGYTYAAGKLKRMRQVISTSLVLAVSMAALCMAISLIFSHQLVEIFLQMGPSTDAGSRFLRILCLGGPFSACAYVLISFFQAIGRGGHSFVLAILRKGILDIPLMFLLNRVLPIYGIVWATPIADVVCCITAILFFLPYIHPKVTHADMLPEQQPASLAD